MLELLRETGKPVDSLYVVSESDDSGHLTGERITNGVILRGPIEVSGGGFDKWAQSTALDEYFARFMRGD